MVWLRRDLKETLYKKEGKEGVKLCHRCDYLPKYVKSQKEKPRADFGLSIQQLFF